MYQTVQFFIQSKMGVLYVTVFKYSLRNFTVNDIALKMTTYFSDDVHVLHAFHIRELQTSENSPFFGPILYVCLYVSVIRVDL